MRNRTAALLALASGLGVGPGFEMLTSTYTMPRQEPDNRGRRAEKDAAKLEKAEEKRKRRAAKMTAANAEIQAGRTNTTMGEGRSTASPGMDG